MPFNSIVKRSLLIRLWRKRMRVINVIIEVRRLKAYKTLLSLHDWEKRTLNWNSSFDLDVFFGKTRPPFTLFYLIE